MATDVGADDSHRGSVLAIIASTEALEAEIQELRERALEKDLEIEALRRVRKTPYTPLSGTFAKLRGFQSGSRRVPLVGSLVRIGEAAADACLRRTSPWDSFEDFAERVGGFLRYIDERVITPQVFAMHASSTALVPCLRLPREMAAACTQRAINQALWAQAKLRSWTGHPAPSRKALDGPDGRDEKPGPLTSTTAVETLGQWIAGLRATTAGDAANVVLVAGNEASDADSIVTAQVYGWFKHLTKAKGSGPVVPVVGCNRQDVTLRKETTLLLSKCGVDYNHLIFLDDPGIEQLLARVTRVTLVDHNKATGQLDALKDKVVEIKDHHKDLGAHPNASGAQREIAFEGDAATAASACSVIAEAFLASDTGRELLAMDDGAAARALLGVILIDAANLDPVKKKVCPRDSAAAAEMMKIAPAPAQAELYRMLDSAKFDAEFWGGLSLQQCFRYDYKKFTTDGKRYGLASCLCSLQLLAAKAGWVDEVASHSKDLDVFGVLTQVRGDGVTGRQLMLYSSDAALAARVAAFAQAYDSPSLKLEAFALDGPPGTHAFTQKNVAASRKQVQPCVGAFFGRAPPKRLFSLSFS